MYSTQCWFQCLCWTHSHRVSQPAANSCLRTGENRDWKCQKTMCIKESQDHCSQGALTTQHCFSSIKTRLSFFFFTKIKSTKSLQSDEKAVLKYPVWRAEGRRLVERGSLRHSNKEKENHFQHEIVVSLQKQGYFSLSEGTKGGHCWLVRSFTSWTWLLQQSYVLFSKEDLQERAQTQHQNGSKPRTWRWSHAQTNLTHLIL